ncbi:MAG: S4 domain-containing protein [Gammaproteobacteria bacterium]|nr:S4 domain-containing protein [Gammaproteobacteria bacterium]MDH5731133.1 S4 domain-containing protein [Gammaproteobacteria bacterium]
MQEDAHCEPVRVDKWLWAARFFKTRSLASDAVNGGKVHLDGKRIKASRKLGIGCHLTVRVGEVEKEVVVLALSGRRGPAKVAQTLYEETAISIEKRQQQQSTMAEQWSPRSERRPNKKDRRQLVKNKREFD